MYFSLSLWSSHQIYLSFYFILCNFNTLECSRHSTTQLELNELNQNNRIHEEGNILFVLNEDDRNLNHRKKLFQFGLLGLEEDLKELSEVFKVATAAELQQERYKREGNGTAGDEVPGQTENSNNTSINLNVSNNDDGGGTSQAHQHVNNEDAAQRKCSGSDDFDTRYFLPKDYNKYEVPTIVLPLPDGRILARPIPSKVSINLRSILNIDEENERIMIDMDFIITWVDGHILKPTFVQFVDYPQLTSMPSYFANKIWKPDIYLDDLVELKKLSFMESPIAIAFDQNTGVVIYKQRLVPIVKCSMEFGYYPADTQICQFSLRSYSYSIEDLNVGWGKPKSVYIRDASDANFDIRIDDLEQKIVPEELYYGINKTYQALSFKLFAKRKLSYHLIQTYVPSIFFVLITWLCFLLPSTMVEARLGITMTTLLTMTAMFAAVRESTPIVSYAKAIDIWMLICIFFIFLTLLEFSFMVWVHHYQPDVKQKEGDEDSIEMKPQKTTLVNDDDEEPQNSLSMFSRAKQQHAPSTNDFVNNSNNSLARHKKYELIANIIDKYAIYFYSTTFLIFIISYWIWLLMSANYFDWNVDPRYNNIES